MSFLIGLKIYGRQKNLYGSQCSHVAYCINEMNHFGSGWSGLSRGELKFKFMFQFILVKICHTVQCSEVVQCDPDPDKLQPSSPCSVLFL